MEFVSLPLIQDFNKLYTDILNCDIVPPPFYGGRVPQSFFLKKRGAFVAVESAQTFDVIYDTYEDGTDTYYIGKIGTNVIVKKNSTTLYTGTYVAGVQYKFFFTTSVTGDTLDSGTGANGETVVSDVVIRDTTKNFTVNAYAGKYLYLYENGTGGYGAGQMFQIDSNDATDLYVTNTGWKLDPSNVSYKIFDSFNSTLSFVAGDYIYVIHNDTDVLPVKTIEDPKDAIFSEGYTYIVTQDNKIFKGDAGFFTFYFSGSSFIGSENDILNIITFQKYILLIGNGGIKAIINNNYISPTTGENIVTPYITQVTTDVGMFVQGAYTVYNQGLYVISQNKKFIGVEISNVVSDRFTVKTFNQGIYIQQFLDKISSTDSIRIGIDDQNIYITVKDSGKSTIFNYDTMYMGWHRWETLLPIYNYKKQKFIGDTLYIKGFDAGKDEGDLEYNQNIRAVIGEDNIFLMKRALLTKLYIGKNTTKGAYIDYNVMAGGNVDKYSRGLDESKYVQDILGYSQQTEGTLGTNLLGLSLLGESLTNGLDLLADFALIENPTGFFYEICIIDIKGYSTEEFEFGGLIMGYNKFEPQVTAYYNVI